MRCRWECVNLRTVGAILYWCEGSKRERDRRLEFVNSDPMMISVFMKYIRAMGVNEKRVRARITIHAQDDEALTKGYWKKVTELDGSNFLPTLVRSGSLSKKPLPHGTLTVRYNSIAFLREVKRDISDLEEKLLSGPNPARRT